MTHTIKHINLMDIICSINKICDREDYDRTPITINLLVNCLGVIAKEYRFNLNIGIVNILQNNLSEIEICLFGLFGFCLPNQCVDCQKLKEDLSHDDWENWVKQRQPYVITPAVTPTPQLEFNSGQESIKQETMVTHSPIKSSTKSENKITICKFGRLCNNPSCIYRHPGQTECRYGRDCRYPNTCPFKHPTITVTVAQNPYPTINESMMPRDQYQPQQHQVQRSAQQPRQTRQPYVQQHQVQQRPSRQVQVQQHQAQQRPSRQAQQVQQAHILTNLQTRNKLYGKSNAHTRNY